MRQAAIDGGDWQIAWLLTHVQDPFQRRMFGGDPEALQHVTTYLRSMNELAKSSEALKKRGSGKGEDEENDHQKGKGKGKDRGKTKEKDKSQNES